MKRCGVAALVVALLTALLAALGASPASAKGKHGPVAWGPSPLSCSYSGQTLSQLRVAPARVSMDKALVRRGGTTQYVGVTATLQGLSGSVWTKVATRPGRHAYAATVQVRPRRMSSVKHASVTTFASGALPVAYSSFRVAVTLKWYAYDGKHVRGSVTRTFGPCARIRPYVTQIKAGASHACAQMSNGSMRCWGAGWNGVLGRGTTASSPVPVVPYGMGSGVTGIAAGAGYACAVQAQAASCWGKDDLGQLGIGRTSSTPVLVPTRVGLSGVRAVAAGPGATCASLGAGGVSCWGSNAIGQVGTGTKTTTGVVSPTRIGATTVRYTVTSLATGSDQACGVEGGNLYCWGNNSHQQMLRAADSTAHVPTQLTTAGNVSAVASGLAHACAIVSGGALDCWGSGSGGALGNGGTTDAGTMVHPKGLTSGVTAVSSYGTATCAVQSGDVLCWGQNPAGQLGTGDTNPSLTPLKILDNVGAIGIAVGNDAGYAWNAAGQVWAWGTNAYGEFGNGTTSAVGQTLPPTPVTIH